MQIEFNATKRTLQGTGASRRLRRTGKVPGIVYGGGKDAQPIEIDHNDLYHALRNEAFHASVLSMNLDGAKQGVILRDVQMHAYKRQVMHIDFQRVDSTHTIHVKVPLHFINADIAPGVKLQGGIVSHVMNEVDVECLPGNLPEFIEVDLAEVNAGQAVHVTHLKLPEGVTAVLHKGEDPVVATVLLGRGAAAEAAAEGEEAGEANKQ